MTPTAYELVARVWDLTPGSAIDAPGAIGDDEILTRARTVIHDEAEILFETPDGGFLGEMGGPWKGADGLRSAWVEWVSGFDDWTSNVDRVEEVGPERVLMLVDCRVRAAGSSQPIDVRAAALYTARDGLIVKVEHFLDQAQARRAAGID